VVVLLTGVVMTGSRGGLIATFAALITVVLFSNRGRGVLIGLGAAAAVLLAAVLVFNPAGLGERQVTQEGSSGRADVWAVGLSACPTYCLTGSGWGTFPVVYKMEQSSTPEARVLRNGVAYQPHNILMQASIEAGVLGLLLVIVALGLALADALRLPAALRPPPVAVLLGTFVSSFFLSNLEFKFFWMVLAYVVLCQNYAASDIGSVDEKNRLYATEASAAP